MKRMHLLVALAVAAVVATFVPSSAMAADDTYPDPALSVNVTGGKLYGGDPVKLAATSSVDCSPLSLTFLGDTVSKDGSSTSHTFDTPVVKSVVARTVKATCTYTDASGASTTVTGEATVTPAAFVGPLAGAVRSATASVILLPRAADEEAAGAAKGDQGNGILPNTGGLPFWLLVAGVVLVIGGGIVATRRRRA